MNNRFPILHSKELRVEVNELMEIFARAGSTRHTVTFPMKGNEALVDEVMKATVEFTPITVMGVTGWVERSQVEIDGNVVVCLME